MPEFKFIRKGIVPHAREIETNTTMVVLPMTLEQVGKEVADEDEEPIRVDSVNDAFIKFKPNINFKTTAGPEGTEFVAEFEFNSLKDLGPDNIQKRIAGKRNDIADLKSTIDLLYRIKERWSIPRVKRAWNNPDQRKQILAAVTKLRGELEKVTQTAKGGE
jgi:predicted component of type VI protein secretion system